MPKVLCTLPNASEEISGVKFVSHANGMLSEDVTDEVAANFASIPGYEIVGAKVKATAPAPADNDDAAAEKAQADAAAEAAEKASAKAAEKAALLAKAEALGVSVKGNWSIERLTSEVNAAAEAKAAAEAAEAEAKAAAEAGEQAKTPAA